MKFIKKHKWTIVIILIFAFATYSLITGWEDFKAGFEGGITRYESNTEHTK